MTTTIMVTALGVIATIIFITIAITISTTTSNIQSTTNMPIIALLTFLLTMTRTQMTMTKKAAAVAPLLVKRKKP